MICWALILQGLKFSWLCLFCGRGKRREELYLMLRRYSVNLIRSTSFSAIYVSYRCMLTLQPEHTNWWETYCRSHNEGKFNILLEYLDNIIRKKISHWHRIHNYISVCCMIFIDYLTFLTSPWYSYSYKLPGKLILVNESARSSCSCFQGSSRVETRSSFLSRYFQLRASIWLVYYHTVAYVHLLYL